MKLACHLFAAWLPCIAGEVVQGKQCTLADSSNGEIAGNALLQFERTDMQKIHDKGHESVEADPVHTFVHITDPQLGMLTQYEADPNQWEWEAEKNTFSELMRLNMKPRPTFFFVGGDMQNFWPNKRDFIDKNSPPGGAKRENKELVKTHKHSGKEYDLGFYQREDVKEIMNQALDFGIPVHYTAGNHDVGDEPDKETMKMYLDNWGPHRHVVLNCKGILYLQINSQLYWEPKTRREDKDYYDWFDEQRKDQNDWLRQQLDNLNKKSTKLVVVMTHIPPFMESPDEPGGWANWNKNHREEVLEIFDVALGEAHTKMLWVVGHFHGNMENDQATYKRLKMKIRLTSSAGSTMQWMGEPHFTAEQANKVAIKTVQEAYKQDIMGGEGNDYKAERVQASPERSGVRVFKVYSDGEFTDEWHTLASLKPKLRRS